jgi:Tol biopolymer transport system component
MFNAHVDYLNAGKLAFSVTPGRNERAWSLVLLDLKTGELRYLADYSNGDRAVTPIWSPDGKYLLYSFNISCEGIFVVDIEGDHVHRIDIGTEDAGDCQAVWSPDGRTIAYMSHRNTGENVYEIEITNRDASYHRRLTSRSGGYPTWSPDGEWITYYSPLSDLCRFRIRPDGSEDQLFIDNPAPAHALSWSPDGMKVAFSTSIWADGNPKAPNWGKQQLYAADADGKNAHLLLPDFWWSCTPIWSPVGDRIAIAGRYDEIYGSLAIYIWEPGELRQLVQQTYAEGDRWNMWSPDGRYIAYAPLHGRSFEGTGIEVIEVSTGQVHRVSDLVAAYPVWCPVI